VLQVVVLYTPFLQRAFSTQPLTLSDWLRCIAIASTVLWVREIEKFARRRISRGRAAAA
jgi:P-type Ca2+ transporter type 2C